MRGEHALIIAGIGFSTKKARETIMDVTRRDFLRTGVIGSAVLALDPAKSLEGAASAVKPVHVPAHFADLVKLKPEEKLLFAAVSAFGDAAALYTPDGKLSRQANLYPDHMYPGKKPPAFAAALERDDGKDGMVRIPVKLTPGGDLLGMIVLHPSDSKYDKEEPQYCRDAKLEMAHHIVAENAHLLGFSGKVAKPPERTAEQRKKYFITLAKDMFATLRRRDERAEAKGTRTDPMADAEVQNAATADELIKAMRKVEPLTASDQHPHVLGVSELFEQIIDKSVNEKDKPPVIDKEHRERLMLGALVHDLAKTQLPSQYFDSQQPKLTKQELQARDEFGHSRNGNHALLTYMMLSPSDAWDAAVIAPHHHGLRRYGPQEIQDLKTGGKVSTQFNDFTLLTGSDIAPEKLPQLAKLLRVADVAEAISGRVNISWHKTVKQLGGVWDAKENPFNKIKEGDGKPVIDPDSIDPDALCFVIAAGALRGYGDKRMNVKAPYGWDGKQPRLDKKDPDDTKYNKDKLHKAENEILDRFGWGAVKDDGTVELNENGKQKQAEIRERVRQEILEKDKLVTQLSSAREAGPAFQAARESVFDRAA